MLDGTVLTEGQKKRYLQMFNSYTNPDYAFQEYPSTPEEAFMNTGTPVFKTSVIKNLITPAYTIDDIYTDLRIYKQPEQWKQYVFGGDTSEGVAGGDYSCIIVRERETAELCACYYGHTDPWEWLCSIVQHLVDLGYWWRIGVEKNNTGYAFYSVAKNYAFYPLLFVQNTVDKVYNRLTQEIGWETTPKTRPIIMTDYKQAINKGYITQEDERIVKEMFTFIYNDKMKEEAQVGYHDDGIMTDSIVRHMRNYPLTEF